MGILLMLLDLALKVLDSLASPYWVVADLSPQKDMSTRSESARGKSDEDQF